MSNFYNLLKSANIQSPTDELIDAMRVKGYRGTNEEIVDVIRVQAKVAKNSTEAEFNEIFNGDNTNVLSALKLSTEEMATMQGGAAGIWAGEQRACIYWDAKTGAAVDANGGKLTPAQVKRLERTVIKAPVSKKIGN
jgi:hypothetical protein